MAEIPTVNSLGKPIALDDLPTEWIGCYDVAMSAADAVNSFNKTVDVVAAIGAKIVGVKSGNPLKYNGTFIVNRLNNKCVLSLERRSAGEVVIAGEQKNRLIKFFTDKRLKHA